MIAPVGTLVGKDRKVARSVTASRDRNTLRLHGTLTDIQIGRSPDTHGWLTPIKG
ncbi:MAG: hypothetical protein R2710_26655 [Acidimicrobiales bacterium]